MPEHAQLVARQIGDLLKQLITNLFGHNGAEWLRALKHFLRKENPWVAPKVPHLPHIPHMFFVSVISDGKTGKGWVKYLRMKGITLDEEVKRTLQTSKLVITSNVQFDLAILKSTHFAPNVRIEALIYGIAQQGEWGMPNAEIACLLREKISGEWMKEKGLSQIVVPLNRYGEYMVVKEDGEPSLVASRSGEPWDDDYGYAFVVGATALERELPIQLV